MLVDNAADAAKLQPGAKVRVTGRWQDKPPGQTKKDEKAVEADGVEVLSPGGPAAATVARRVLKPRPPSGPPAPSTRVRVPNAISLTTVKALFIPSAIAWVCWLQRNVAEHAALIPKGAWPTAFAPLPLLACLPGKGSLTAWLPAHAVTVDPTPPAGMTCEESGQTLMGTDGTGAPVYQTWTLQQLSTRAYTDQQLADILYGGSTNTYGESLASYFADCSYNKVTLAPLQDSGGSKILPVQLPCNGSV